jgi:DNA-binding protein H-NS
MAQTYAQVAKQIAALHAKAEKLKRQEVGEVIAKIKKAIAAYGITVQELFGKVAATKSKATTKKTKSAGVPKYSDGNGNVWGGRGPRPQWLRDALARGKQLADFLADGDGKGNGVAPTAKRSRRHARRPPWFWHRTNAGETARRLIRVKILRRAGGYRERQPHDDTRPHLLARLQRAGRRLR